MNAHPERSLVNQPRSFESFGDPRPGTFPWRSCIAAATMFLAPFADAEQRGIINDPDGYVNVRDGKSTNANIITTVKENEPFTFERDDETDWCKVTLKSGKTGWMHWSRIRMHFTKDDLSKKTDVPEGETELASYGKGKGVDYYKVMSRATQGEPAALKQYLGFSEDVDGGAAEGYYSDLIAVLHMVGDTKFAALLNKEPIDFQMLARQALLGAAELNAIDTTYYRRHFPKTAELFFRREITAWPSPDGRYVIRKTFSPHEEIQESKVTHSELIEKASGKTVLNLAPHDIGFGLEREGDVLWSPDSKRFAYLSIDVTFRNDGPKGPDKKQTLVFENLGSGFAKVDLPLSEPPGRKEDAELKDAEFGHSYIEPVKWLKADVLQLERHDYFQVRKGIDRSLHGVDRLYEITVTFPTEGAADVKWKLQEDR